MPKKKVYVRCYAPIAVDSSFSVPWCDVWLRFHDRRKTAYKAPTLRSRLNLLSDLEINQECAAEYPVHKSLYEDDIQKYNWILRFLESNPFYCDLFNVDQPDIFTAKDLIDRAEAERMIDWYLRSLGFNGCVQKWKRPSCIVRPLSILNGVFL